MTSTLQTLSQYAHKSVVPSDVCTRICATRLANAFTGHANICPSNNPWCTHAPLNEFFCLVIRNFVATADKISCLLALRGRGERKPKVFISLKKCRHSPKNVEFLVVSPVALVQYVPQRANDNKMQQFIGIPLLAALESLIY